MWWGLSNQACSILYGRLLSGLYDFRSGHECDQTSKPCPMATYIVSIFSVHSYNMEQTHNQPPKKLQEDLMLSNNIYWQWTVSTPNLHRHRTYTFEHKMKVHLCWVLVFPAWGKNWSGCVGMCMLFPLMHYYGVTPYCRGVRMSWEDKQRVLKITHKHQC